MKTVSALLCIVPACLFAVPAIGHAADLAVSVTDVAGKPVRSAVVTFTPANGAVVPAALKSSSFVLTQKDMKFAPYVLAVPAGATVNFPNQDRVSHHVYSFSKIQPFQFPLYGQGKTRSLRFDHPGTVAVACNIHDSMSAYVRVVETPYFATTDGTGRVTLINLPETAGTLSVWQPMMDAPEHAVARSLTPGRGNSVQSFSVKVRSGALPAGGAY